MTSEFVDLRGRLKALQLAHEKLSGLMDKAGKVQQVLSVLEQLTSNLQKKEALEARIQTMARLAALSTLRVSIEEEEAARTPPPAPPRGQWRGLLALQNAGEEWLRLFDLVTGVLVHVCIFDLPVATLGLLGLCLLGAALRRAWLCAAPWLPAPPWPMPPLEASLVRAREAAPADVYPEL